MWAMIPMLRTLARSFSTSSATGMFPCLEKLGPAWLAGAPSPAIVGEGLVGLRHLVRVLAALHARPEAVARIEQLVHQPLLHGLFPARAREADQPAQRQRGRPRRLDLDRHLV